MPLKSNLLCALLAFLFLPLSLKANDKSPLMRDFIGINGHTVQFDAELYQPLCRHVRDYHNLGWDTGDKTPSNATSFPLSNNVIKWDSEGRRIPAHNGKVNWNTLYRGWLDQGFEINASICFGGILPDQWTDLEEDAYRYGKAFAEYFGPSGEHKLVTAAEIGNEPAGKDEWTDELYEKIFIGMARGIRDGDPKMKILTCTAEPAPSDKYSKDLELFQKHTELYDVINIHKYAMLEHWPTYERSHPDDPNNPWVEDIQKSIDWRNKHAPDKPVWITEFGYDAASDKADKNPKPDKFHTVTDKQQAQWIIRSFLLLSSMDFERAYLYWANDNDKCSLHAASGVTRKYEPKQSYWAMRHLQSTLGDYRFNRIIEHKNNELYVFEYTHENGPSKKIWVAWSPTGVDRTTEVELDIPGHVQRAERMPLNDGPPEKVSVNGVGTVTLPISESPTYLWIES